MKLLLRAARRGRKFLRRLRVKRAARAISRVNLLRCLIESKTLDEFLLHFRLRKMPLFFLDGKNAELLKEIFPQSEKVIVKDADEICAHNFDFLGSGRRNVDTEEGKVDWHRDFKSGERWQPSVFYTDTVRVKGNGSDIKVPWELSRFQHLPTLGKAYWLTDNEKYSREFVDEISDWIESNPPEFGVNWTSTMDVAIRAVNWIWGYYFFKNSPEVNDEFLFKFLKSLLIHGKHIRGNLERSWRRTAGNHYLSNIVGLVYLGMMFPEFKEAKKWREFGFKELVREMKRQVYPDGVNYEGSISYHRLVTEFFLSATLLCLKNGVAFPDWYMKRLEKMIEFVMYYTKPDGTAPQIGDNDDGRLHILANYGTWNRLDHQYLLSIGNVLFNRPDFKYAAGELSEEAFWLLGEEGVRRFDEHTSQNIAISSKAFEGGGFYIMHTDSLYMLLDCVPADPGAPYGHKHDSRLSFELFAYDKSFIIDPGAYIYTADREMRNLFRSNTYHNAVVVNGREQGQYDEDEFFRMRINTPTKVNRWEVTKEYDFLDAERSEYKSPVTHRRQILFDKAEGYWLIRDILSGEGTHQFDLYFHFAPLKIELARGFPLVIKTKVEGANLAIIPLEAEGVSVKIAQGWVSYRYGVKVKAPIVKYSKESQTLASFCNILYPFVEATDINEVVEKARGRGISKLLEVESETGL